MNRFNVYILLAIFFTGSAISSPAAHSAQNDSFMAILEAELLGGYSQIEGRDGEFSSIDSWLFSPTWKVSDKLYWINLYNGSYNRSTQVVAQEEGGRQTNTTQSHNLSTSAKYFMNDSWSLRPLFAASWIFVNETEDEDFGKGLYDYEELIGGIESEWTTLKTSTQEDDVHFGFRYVDREYPNYQSLLSQFNPNGSVETNEKDLNGYKFNLSRSSRTKDAWSWEIEGIFFYKDYTDKLTVNENGIRTNDGREDFVEYLNGSISRPLGSGWSFRLEGQVAANQSNLDFYDTHNTLALTDDDFVKNYFDYFSFLIKPSLRYIQKWDEDRNFVASVDYSFYALHYPGRKAQNTAGRYQAEDQQDYTHTFSGKVGVPITKNLSWVTFVSYTVADSNQDFQNFYLYEYDLWTAVTGVSIKY